MAESPKTARQLLEIVRSAHSPIVAVGGRTKPALSDGWDRVSTRELTGIIEYQPSEFTFTALAGTTLREIADELAKNGQYLPFDPPLIDAGATLGGTLAAGMSGPGAYRFGTVRDFVLGIEFVDGNAKDLLRAGGKVVKNAAGYDLPKFVTGSAGRFGILTELTFKVFPCPPASATVAWPVETIAAGVRLLRDLSRGPWDLDALELDADPASVVARLRGEPDAAQARIKRLLGAHPGGAEIDGTAFWAERASLGQADPATALVKVALTPDRIDKLDRELAGAGAHRFYGLGGNVAWIAHHKSRELDDILGELELPGLATRLRDTSGDFALGAHSTSAVLNSLKQKLDPHGKFPPWPIS